MKKETSANRLNELLGLAEKAKEVKTRATGKVMGVTEEEIQEFREVQGLMYFLMAPALFTPKKCPHCGDHFLVSRKYVAFCSYTCIEKSLAEQGVKWSKGQDLETLILDPQVYDGNEPLWIRKSNLERIQEILASLLESNKNEDGKLDDTSPPKLNKEPSSEPLLESPTPSVTSSPAPTKIGVGNSIKKSSSRRSVKKRVVVLKPK